VREAILMASRRNNVWLAPDSYVFHLGRDDWLHAVNSNLLGFADRFLFASAYPLNALKPQIERFHSLGGKRTCWPKLLHRNAIAALRLRERPSVVNSPEWAGRMA
jgi:predicted TIM-barrel fold metal-dependent hydrolase